MKKLRIYLSVLFSIDDFISKTIFSFGYCISNKNNHLFIMKLKIIKFVNKYNDGKYQNNI